MKNIKLFTVAFLSILMITGCAQDPYPGTTKEERAELVKKDKEKKEQEAKIKLEERKEQERILREEKEKSEAEEQKEQSKSTIDLSLKDKSFGYGSSYLGKLHDRYIESLLPTDQVLMTFFNDHNANLYYFDESTGQVIRVKILITVNGERNSAVITELTLTTKDGLMTKTEAEEMIKTQLATLVEGGY